MTAQKIDRAEWQTFFDTLSKGLLGMRAEIEVASLALGDQIAAEWVLLLGITYDLKDDVLEIASTTSTIRSGDLDSRRAGDGEFRGDRRRWRLADHHAARAADAAGAIIDNRLRAVRLREKSS